MNAPAESQLFRMPTLGADMTEGRVVEWLVEPGQPVARGDIVAVIDTDKSDIEVEVFEPCVFEEFLVEIGETVDVGTPIARITRLEASTTATRTDVAPAEPSEVAVAPAEPSAVAVAPAEPVAQAARRRPASPPGGRHRLTPRARRLAAGRGIAPDRLPSGFVSGDAVLAAAEAEGPSAATREPPTERAAGDRAGSMRRVIAERMQRSWTEIPHYHVTDRIDLTAVTDRIAAHNVGRAADGRVVTAAVLNTAIARAAADVPDVNGWWLDGAMRRSDTVDLGIVVSLRGGGIVVPVISGAEHLDVDAMMDAMRELVERARRGRLRPRDVTDASITVTNLGERGPAEVYGVIHPPQVALVGIGGLRDEPRVVDGEMVAARMVHVTVAGDHRAHDGTTVGRLLERINHHLEALP